MKIKVSKADGVVLDYLVATAEGIEVVAWNALDREAYFVVHKESFVDKEPTTFYGDPDDTFNPSVYWAQGGPIIDAEGIMFYGLPDDQICAYLRAQGTEGVKGVGPTHLIAAMRCYVASKLGEEVDVPDELM